MTKTRYGIAIGCFMASGLIGLVLILSDVMKSHWRGAAEGALYIIVVVLLGLRTRHAWSNRS